MEQNMDKTKEPQNTNAVIQTAQPTEHQRAHTGQEPSECNECEEAFKISNFKNIRRESQFQKVGKSLAK